MALDPVKLNAALTIATGLIQSGVQIFELLKGKEEITEEDLKQIIEAENEAQAKARAELAALLQ